MKVLILEDDELVAQGLVRCLGYLGHEGVHLRHVAQARARVQDAAFDVALIDIGLDDGESGEEFMTWLGREQPSVSRVLISGLERPAGFVDEPPRQLFMRKPFGHAELAKLLRSLQTT
ncbi:MAG TPA: response regulator [Polyangia bacterium]|nr:response regulator [Polyangia bacterium]